jgi:tRNA threonylcarbamoyladenosine biosynthesis protein TsaB
VFVLGVDTATAVTSVAVGNEAGSLASVAVRHERAHAELLAPSVRWVLDHAGVEPGSLAGIAVGTGPGLFTGLRVGVATAKALAQAWKLPMVAVPSLDLVAFAHRHAAKTICATIDARRGELFAALFDPAGAPLWPPLVAAPEALVERVQRSGSPVRAAGDGSIRFRGVLEAAGIRVEADDSGAHVVRALHVCRLAQAVPGRPPEAVLPDYIRAPDAKTP